MGSWVVVLDVDARLPVDTARRPLYLFAIQPAGSSKNCRAWAGDSVGHWDGDALVVDVADLNGRSWLDQSRNLVDENEHVVERFTMTGPDTIVYEPRVDAPTVFSRPWTMRIPLRRQPKGTELIEYDCIEGERDEIHYPGADSPKH